MIVGGKRVGTINLYSASAANRDVADAAQVLPAQAADVVLKVKSTGLKVRIDGVVISRT